MFEGLLYKVNQKDIELIGYLDDYARDGNKRKSMSSYVFILYGNGSELEVTN